MSFCFNSGEVFQTAIVIEKNGLSFYERARQAVKDPEIAELFASLAKEEVAHQKRFESLLRHCPKNSNGPR